MACLNPWPCDVVRHRPGLLLAGGRAAATGPRGDSGLACGDCGVPRSAHHTFGSGARLPDAGRVVRPDARRRRRASTLARGVHLVASAPSDGGCGHAGGLGRRSFRCRATLGECAAADHFPTPACDRPLPKARPSRADRRPHGSQGDPGGASDKGRGIARLGRKPARRGPDVSPAGPPRTAPGLYVARVRPARGRRDFPLRHAGLHAGGDQGQDRSDAEAVLPDDPA
jgi:hypothetical protein